MLTKWPPGRLYHSIRLFSVDEGAPLPALDKNENHRPCWFLPVSPSSPLCFPDPWRGCPPPLPSHRPGLPAGPAAAALQWSLAVVQCSRHPPAALPAAPDALCAHRADPLPGRARLYGVCRSSVALAAEPLTRENPQTFSLISDSQP